MRESVVLYVFTRFFAVDHAVLLAAFMLSFLGIAIPGVAQSVLPLPTGAANVAGEVLSTALQADGKIVIGGNFIAVDGTPRSNIARLNTDGSLDTTWDPSADGQVITLVVSGSIVYAGGNFGNIGGQSRSRIAALDATSGLATAWNPSADNAVYAITVSGSTIYAGGLFANIGGQPRSNIAALDTSAGLATGWNPVANNWVRAIAISGSTIYAGGTFTNIGGQPRSQIAALDATSGLATSWNPSANAGGVKAIAVSGSTVYAGGAFSNIGGQPRSRLAALDAGSGLATAWNPSADNTVYAVTVSGSTIYAGGYFTNIGGQPRTSLAALDETNGMATTWNPNVKTDLGLGPPNVFAIAVSGNSVYAGGAFRYVGGALTGGFARIDASSGVAAATPQVSTYPAIQLLQPQADGKVIIVGNFDAVNNVARHNIARLNVDGSVDTTWNPGTDGTVQALAVSGSTVYVAGSFTNIGGQPRNSIAALDETTGLATAWNPAPDYGVSTIAISGSTVYAGGTFTNIGGQSRSRIAALDATSGLATPWNPGADNGLSALAVSGSTVYAGGYFTNIGGQPRNNIAALSAATGLATAWNPNADFYVLALAVSGNTVYAVGPFANIGGQPRNSVAALDATSGLASAWNPAPDYGVSSLTISGSTVYVAGGFTNIGGQARVGLAALDEGTGLAAWSSAMIWNPAPNNGVSAIAASGSTIYVGGGFFTNIGGQARAGLAALSPSDVILHNGFESGPIPVNFALGADDYGSLTIGGQPVCTYDNITAGGGCKGTVNMLPGAWYDIAIDYKNRAGTDGMSLTWDQPNGPAIMGYGFSGSYPNLIPLANFRTLNASNNYISGLRGDYYDLSGNFQSTVFGEGPIDAANTIYNNQNVGSWNGYGYYSLFEERLSGQIQLP